MVEIIEEYEKTEQRIKSLKNKIPDLSDKEKYLEKENAGISFIVLLMLAFVFILKSGLSYGGLAYLFISILLVYSLYDSYKAKEKLYYFDSLEKSLKEKIQGYEEKLIDIKKLIESENFKLTEKDYKLLSKKGREIIDNANKKQTKQKK